jgi:hypothetical protein
VTDEERREHGKQLFDAFCESTGNLATGMIALCERLERSHQLRALELEELRASREQNAALQRQIGVLVQVIARQQGVPVQAVPQPADGGQQNWAQGAIHGAIQGMLGRAGFPPGSGY